MAMAALGCEHTTPFSFDNDVSTTPFQKGDPARLTFNPGLDTRASWLPDGSAFLFTEEQTGRPDRDQCIAVMPGTGGTITRTICADSDVAADSVNVFLAPAVSSEGRLAYLRTSTLANRGRPTQDHAAVVLATYTAPQPGTVIQSLPYFSPDSQPVDVVSDIHWAAGSVLFFLADHFQIICLNLSCTVADTSLTGLEIDRIVLAPSGPILTAVPGTVGATALATAGPDTVFFALAGSGQVHRLVVGAPADSVIFTFPGSVTGLSVAAGRLAAAVNGTLHLLTLATAADTVLPVSGPNEIIDHPALDPTGHFLIADVTDTSSGLPADLWLWRLP